MSRCLGSVFALTGFASLQFPVLSMLSLPCGLSQALVLLRWCWRQHHHHYSISFYNNVDREWDFNCQSPRAHSVLCFSTNLDWRLFLFPSVRVKSLCALSIWIYRQAVVKPWRFFSEAVKFSLPSPNKVMLSWGFRYRVDFDGLSSHLVLASH